MPGLELCRLGKTYIMIEPMIETDYECAIGPGVLRGGYMEQRTVQTTPSSMISKVLLIPAPHFFRLCNARKSASAFLVYVVTTDYV